MKRPTIPDLAKAAGVSVSTVNRIINGAGNVRQSTRESVLRAAEDIGFYGVGAITQAVHAKREYHKLGVMLQQGARTFYRELGEAMRRVAETHPECRIDLTLDFLDDMSPENVSNRLLAMSEDCESIAMVAAQHPIIAEAIDTVLDKGIPVAALIGPLSARGNVSFVGLDNWKVGRTAAWAFDKMVREPGKIGILVGNHRFRNQQMNESGFRSYMREHDKGFTLLEPQATYESAAAAREIVEKLFQDHPDMCGLFISGGGITGAISALRDLKPREDFVAVGYELFDQTRGALSDGTLTMLIAHPIETFARETIATLIKAKKVGPQSGALRVALGFDIHTPENL